ncbi:MAG: CocE/NonD family hydrolase [Candidatus Acidiferrum sp.]
MTVRRLAILVLLLFLACRAESQDLVENAFRIPAKDAGKKGLEAVMVRPNEPGPHPLAVVTHGAPREGSDRAGMSPWQMIPQAREFARRGWTTVVVMRRGYGDSGGRFQEDARACSNRPDFYDAGKESAKDLRESIAYLSTLPEVDPSRIISVGISAGGFATAALTADPPPGLVAAISFAGGRGSMRPDDVCHPEELIRAFRSYGEKSRVPMLWVYSENDHFFGPRIAQAFFEAFTQAGGKATFIRAAPFRRDGHGLFSLGGIPIWTGLVDDFLQAQNLTLRSTLLPLPQAPDLPPPAELKPGSREEFRDFLTLPAYKAFAVSSEGHYGYVFGRRSEKDAQKLAIQHCEENAPGGDHCNLVPIDVPSAEKNQAKTEVAL